MLEFFTTMMIITGGCISVLFWILVILALLIELKDWINPRSPGVIELGEDEYR